MDAAPPAILRLLAHDLRWSLARALAAGDYRVGELVAQVGQPMNLVSYHLKRLRAAGLVRTRRSEADGRDIYYSLNIDHLRAQFAAAGGALHPSLGVLAFPPPPRLTAPPRVLFICTHNSARSQMAEALLRRFTGGRANVTSAGSQPAALHPDAIRTMDALGIDIRTQQPKPLSAVAGQSFDYVITVCDRAREVCPVFPGGQPLHWGFPDPAAIADPAERAAAFADTARGLQSRLAYFLMTLPAQ